MARQSAVGFTAQTDTYTISESEYRALVELLGETHPY